MKYFLAVRESGEFVKGVTQILKSVLLDIKKSEIVEGSDFCITDDEGMVMLLIKRVGVVILLDQDGKKLSFCKRYNEGTYLFCINRSLSARDFREFEEFVQTAYVKGRQVDANFPSYFIHADGEISPEVLHTLGGDLGVEVDEEWKADIVITNVETIGRQYLEQQKAVFFVCRGLLYFNSNGLSYPQFTKFPRFV